MQLEIPEKSNTTVDLFLGKPSQNLLTEFETDTSISKLKLWNFVFSSASVFLFLPILFLPLCSFKYTIIYPINIALPFVGTGV
jgi:hypothetical protein